MRRFSAFILAIAVVGGVQASWYWPFGSDEDEKEQPRVSELMEPATTLIEEASDLAAEGKVSESVEKYRAALKELDRIEQENPERAASAEFATLRNKRAYVNAAIDTMHLSQVKENAKAVALSDTTELEKRLAEEKTGKKKVADLQLKTTTTTKPRTKREQAMQAIGQGDFPTAERVIGELLKEKPNGAAALNLKAALEARQGKLKEAESTLDQAIMSNPRNPAAYYNMAKLMLQVRPDDTSVAKRYYETGRAVGGAADRQLEAAFK